MSVIPADPKQTHALLIGIETYYAGEDWNLDGPARDVIEVYKWLLKNEVPKAHIRVLVSPMPKNEGRLDDADITWERATSRLISRELTELHVEEGQLLIVFWAGHGSIQQAGDNVIQNKQHRLFTADATADEKKNFEWASLRNSLASDYFKGFRRQIVIVDACADFRKDFKLTTTGESITAGKEMRCEQFVFFAARPGETAKNLGEEGRGLFSRELLRILGELPGDAWPPDMNAVAQRVQESFDALRERGDAAQMPRFDWTDSLGNTQTFFPPDAGSSSPTTFALVIGVSEYKHGIAPNQELQPHQFTNLAAAAQDAQAMHRFLAKQPGYVVAQPLLNEKATRSGILHELDNIRKLCRGQGPKNIVQIFFSGHGAQDDAGRSYLVPHDGRRDQLFATALWDKTVDAALREIADARVVLFLDACHSGGVGTPQDKSGPGTFNPRSLSGDPAGGGRYILASCQTGQRSYEIEGEGEKRARGIFTSHLLELLGDDADASSQAGGGGEDTDEEAGFAYPFREAEIDLLDLADALKEVVRQTAAEKARGTQDPFANFTTRTGICFPNRILERRQRKHLEKIKPLIRRLDPRAPVGMIEQLLRNFLAGRQDPKYTEFYEYFAEGALNSTTPERRQDYADLLLTKFNEVWSKPGSSTGVKSGGSLRPSTSIDPASKGGQAATQTQRVAAGQLDSGPSRPAPQPGDPTQMSPAIAPAPVVLPAATPLAATVTVATVTGGRTAATGVSDVLTGGAERRRFESNDARYILYSLADLDVQFDDPALLDSCRPTYDAIYDSLLKTLTDTLGVSRRKIDSELISVGKRLLPKWNAIEAEITLRLDEKWPNATHVPMTMLGTVGIRNFTG